MRLPNLAFVLVAGISAAALPSCAPLRDCFNANNDQHPLVSDDVIGSSLDTPWHPGHPFPEPPSFPPPSGHETIYATLSKDPRFSRIIKAIDRIEEVATLLNNTSVGITFFAPDNKALRHPKKHRSMSDEKLSGSGPFGGAYDLDDVLSRLEALDQPHSSPYDEGDDDDDDQKERKRRFFRMLLHAILEYHILPRTLDTVSLRDKMTHSTHLIVDKALGGNPQRIRTEQKSIPSVLVVNLYSHVVRPDMEASNGLIHVVDHPLFPPPSTFQNLFMAPSHFSVFTSAIQRTGLTDALDFHFTNDEDEDESRVGGTPTVTVFAPTNKAFEELPKDLQLFLFSPFGGHVLRKLLQYHIVPDYVLHSDYTFNRSEGAPPDFDSLDSYVFDLDSELHYRLDNNVRPGGARPSVLTNDGSLHCMDYDDNLEELDDDQSIKKKHKHKHKKPKHPKKPTFPCPEPISLVDLTLPTLYEQRSLDIHIGKFKLVLPIPHHDHPYRIITKFTVNGHKIRIPDLVAMNGAVHIIDKLLDPRGPHHYYGINQISGSGYSQEEMESWESWKTWLCEWAEM